MGGSGDLDLDTTVTTLNATNNSGNASDSIVITDSGALALGVVSNASGDVTLVAGGAITDSTPSDDATINIIAATANLTAVGGIGSTTTATEDIDTAVTTFTGLTNNNSSSIGDIVISDSSTGATAVTAANNSTGGGGIYIIDSDSSELTLTSLYTREGMIDVKKSGGNLVATSVNSSNLGGSNINLTALSSGNIELAEVNAGAGTVTVNSVGAITDDGDAATGLTAATASLTASGGIGTSADSLETTVTTFPILSTDTGGIYITDSGGTTLSNVDVASSGAIDISTSGALLATDVVSANGNIDLTSTTGNITVGEVTADTTDDVVTLTAGSGAITDDGDAATGLTAATASLTASGGICTSADALDTIVGNFSVLSTDTGGIYIDDAGGTTLSNVDVTSSGAIDISTSGALVVTDVANANGNISLTTTGDGNDITVSTITAIANTVTLVSSGSITELDTEIISLDSKTFEYSGMSTNITANTVNLNAEGDIGTAETDISDLSTGTASGSLDISSIKLSDDGNILGSNSKNTFDDLISDFVFPSRGALDIKATKLSSSSGGNTFIYAKDSITISGNSGQPGSATGNYTIGAGGSILFDATNAKTQTGGNQTYVYGLNGDINPDGDGYTDRDRAKIEFNNTNLDAVGNITITANRTQPVLIDIAAGATDLSLQQLGLTSDTTIFNNSGGSVSIAATGDFKVGQYEKIVVGSATNLDSDLSISANNIFVGDVSVSSDLTLTAVDTVYIIERSPQPTYDTDQIVATDAGSDFVVRDRFILNTTDFLGTSTDANPFQEIIAVGVGLLVDGDVPDNVNLSDRITIGLQDRDVIFTNDSSFDYIADPTGDITYNPEFTRPEVFEVEPAEQRVPEALREELLKLRIFARELNKEEKNERRRKGYVYTPQIIVDELAPISAYEVALNRISAEVAQDAVDFAKELIGKDGENLEAISKAIGLAFEEFVESNPNGTSEDFAQYLSVSTTPAAMEAFEYVDGFNQLFEKIENMGVTETELSISRRNILSRLRVQGLRGREMIEFFDSFVLAKKGELSLSM
jgi:hypothetical protein